MTYMLNNLIRLYMHIYLLSEYINSLTRYVLLAALVVQVACGVLTKKNGHTKRTWDVLRGVRQKKRV